MHQRRRIVLLFGIGIVLPSVLLSYLAFRGIQNDRALAEKERLEGIRRAADQVVRAVDSRITKTERSLAEILAERSRLSPEATLRDLDRFVEGDALVEQVFCLRSSTELQFPVAKPLYLLDQSMEAEPSPAGNPSRPPEFYTAERKEFREKDFQGALDGYRRSLQRTEDPRLKGIILNAVARVQKKSGQAWEAVSTYETIAREHSKVVMAGGIPLGPTALLETAALAQELGDAEKSIRTALRLYRGLMRREWVLEKADFELFSGRVKSHIKSLLANPPPDLDQQTFRAEYQALGNEEARARRRTERMALFLERSLPALEARLRTPPASIPSGQSFARGTLDTESASYFVTIKRPASTAGKAQDQTWGLVLDNDELLENILQSALRDHFPPGAMAWTVKGKDNRVILSSEDPVEGPSSYRAPFASNLPDWTIEFHQPPPRLIRTFLGSQRGLYFFVFLLIAGILVFGLVLTLRSVSHELELARMKSDFVSTVSHEFKSPLTSIRQLAEMLQSGRAPTEERRQKYYEVLLEQSERLALLTDNILSLAKIEEGHARLALERTDIAELLRSVVAAFRDRFGHEGFEIALEIDGSIPPLAVDRTALSQALTNLVDNAVKYSGASRRIEVGAVAEDAKVAITVRDFGVGIKKDDVPRLFERFFRAGDELTRTVKGSGLGLTLVKEIVDAHGGRVDVASEPGQGSVFTVRLPMPREKEDRP